MRFKTFRNFILLPSGLLLTAAVCGGFALLLSSASCGRGTATEQARTTSQPVSVTPSAPPAPITQPSHQTASPAARDEAILAMLEAKRSQPGDKIKDALPREAYKVNVYRDPGSTTWSRVKIDYNRNERWEEKWDLEDGKPVKKQISSADNEVYDQEFRWQGGQWVPKKR